MLSLKIIHYNRQLVFTLMVLAHAEYSKNQACSSEVSCAPSACARGQAHFCRVLPRKIGAVPKFFSFYLLAWQGVATIFQEFSCKKPPRALFWSYRGMMCTNVSYGLGFASARSAKTQDRSPLAATFPATPPLADGGGEDAGTSKRDKNEKWRRKELCNIITGRKSHAKRKDAKKTAEHLGCCLP